MKGCETPTKEAPINQKTVKYYILNKFGNSANCAVRKKKLLLNSKVTTHF